MYAFRRLLLVVFIAGSLLVPFFASAYGISFGGRVVDMNFCVNGAIQFTVLPAGKFPITYLWTPLVRHNYLSPTPTKPPVFGEQILGFALPAPTFCLGPGKYPHQYFGLPVQYERSSYDI